MTKCLLAISSSNILTAGMEHLLSSNPELDFISLPIQDRHMLIEAIYRNQVDVVILEGDKLIEKDFLASLLSIRPGLMLIQIDSNDNQLHIYNHQHLTIRHPSELIALMQSHGPETQSKEGNLEDA